MSDLDVFALLMAANEAEAAIPDDEHPGYMVGMLAAANLGRLVGANPRGNDGPPGALADDHRPAPP